MVISGCGPELIRTRYHYDTSSTQAMVSMILGETNNCPCLQQVGPCTFEFKFLIRIEAKYILKFLMYSFEVGKPATARICPA